MDNVCSSNEARALQEEYMADINHKNNLRKNMPFIESYLTDHGIQIHKSKLNAIKILKNISLINIIIKSQTIDKRYQKQLKE